MLLGAGRPCAPSRKGRAAFALRRADVNLLTKTISVSRSLKDVNGRQIFGPTKTHEHRTVAILGFLATLLRQHRQPLGGVGPDALVFVQRNGNPIRHGNFYHQPLQARGASRASARAAQLAVPRPPTYGRESRRSRRGAPEGRTAPSRPLLHPGDARPLHPSIPERRGEPRRGARRPLRRSNHLARPDQICLKGL